MGKLLDMLERATRGAVEPLGFAPANRQAKLAPVLLLGNAKAGDKAQARRIVEAGLTAAVLSAEAALPDQLSGSAATLKEIVWGVWQTQIDPSPAEGVDFEVFASEDAPISALNSEERTTVMQVLPEADDALLRGLGRLPVDAFLVSIADSPLLTLRQLMRISRVRSASSKYLLVHVAALPSSEELKQLHSTGVNALVVDVGDHPVEALKDLQARMLELPKIPKSRRQRRPEAVVPTVRVMGPGAPPEPEEEDDEDDE